MCLAGSRTPESAPKDQPGPTTTGTCLTGKRPHRFRQTTCLLEVLARSIASRICARRKDKTARRAALPHSLIASSMNLPLRPIPRNQRPTSSKQAPARAQLPMYEEEVSNQQCTSEHNKHELALVGVGPGPPQRGCRAIQGLGVERRRQIGGGGRQKTEGTTGQGSRVFPEQNQPPNGHVSNKLFEVICIPTITSTTPLYNRRSRPTAAAMLLWRKAILCRT